MNTKKIQRQIVLVTVLLLVLSGFSMLVQAQDMECMVDEDVTGTLVFWGHADHPLDNIRDAFLECYPNVTLDWQYQDDHAAKWQTAMAAGTGAPDLYWSEAALVQQYGALGALLDVSNIVEPKEDLYISGKLAEAYIGSTGAYVGVPGDYSASGIYYNKKVLDELGIEVPEEMMYEDFIALLEEIAAAGKNAVVMPNEPGTLGMAYYSWFNAAFGGSGPVACDNSEVRLNDEASVSAVELMRDIVATGATLEADWLSPEYWDAISNDQLVLALAAAWERGFWESNIDESQFGNWRVVPLPRAMDGGPNSGVFGGATLVAPATTENPQLVTLFMDFAFGTMDGATAAGDWGIIPSYIPYLEGPFQEKQTQLFGDQNIGETFLAMDTGTEFCRTAAFGAAVNEYLVPELNSMIRQGEDVQSTLDFIADDFDGILIDYQN